LFGLNYPSFECQKDKELGKRGYSAFIPGMVSSPATELPLKVLKKGTSLVIAKELEKLSININWNLRKH
jgi:hypothetical protein